MIVDRKAISTKTDYEIVPDETQYRVCENAVFTIKPPLKGTADRTTAAAAVDGDQAHGILYAQAKECLNAPKGWDWKKIPDDADIGVLSRAVADFFLSSVGMHREHKRLSAT